MGRLFTKGTSGNPAGRPSTKALREALHPSEPLANKRLIELIGHRSPKIALTAISIFYDEYCTVSPWLRLRSLSKTTVRNQWPN